LPGLTKVRPKSEIRQIHPTKLRKYCLNACGKTVFVVVKLSQRLNWINIEAISKKGFWFKFAAGPSFHAKPDDASILIFKGAP
jgi:hypothetical protein